MRRLTSVGSVSPSPRRAFRPFVRQRVSQLLDSAYQYPVTVLIAGAGYGKSVALDHWLQGKQEVVVRYNVREGTHGVFEFTLGLAEALAPFLKIGPRAAANAVNAATRSDRPEHDLAVWLEGVLRKFTGTIVIDDFHASGGDAAARLVSSIVDRTQERTRWVIASRNASGLPVTSWIAYGKSQMALGERDLAFTHDEAMLAAETFEIQFTSSHLNELYAYTLGWPTALTFALLSSQKTFDLQELRASTENLTYQFLAEQVLLTLPADDVDFLLQTSTYDRIDLDVLTAAGIDEPRARLQFLRDNGSFIAGDADGTYRYHDLFRDFLRSELAKDDKRYDTAWRSAAAAYERLGQWELALAAYRRIGAKAAMLDVLREHGFDLMQRGRSGAVVRALEFADSTLAHDDATILGLRAACEASGSNAERAAALYRRAIATSISPVQEAALRLEFSRELSQHADPEGIDVLEPALAAQIPDAQKSYVMGALATQYWQSGKAAKAFATMERATRLAAPLSDAPLHATLGHQYAYLMAMSGRNREAMERAMTALQTAKAEQLHGLSARIQSLLYYMEFYAENPSQTLWWLKQMERSARDAGDMTLLFSALAGTYELETERANADAIARLGEELRAFDSQRFIRATSTLLPSFALQAAWSRRFDESLRILIEGGADRRGSPLRCALRASEVALYAAAAGNRDRAEEAFKSCQDYLRTESEFEPYAPVSHVKALVFSGLSQMLIGKMSNANRAISDAERLRGSVSERSKALIAAARSMFVHVETRMFDDEVAQALELLEKGGWAGYARMLQALPLPALNRDTPSAILTRTEVTVLRSLARAGDSKAAAADLGKSSHTIDWHVKSILKKLGVSTRREAIAFAREQGLI